MEKVLSVLLLGLMSTSVYGDDMMAKCELKGQLKGVIMFEQKGENVQISGEIENLGKGYHGFHLHVKGELGNGCKDAGGHYNPFNQTHGSLTSTTRHEGDFGNIMAGDDGKAKIDILDKNTKIKDILNRAIVVHEKKDDLGQGGNDESLKTGNAGSRLDCCKVESTSGNSAHFNKMSLAVGVLALVSLYL